MDIPPEYKGALDITAMVLDSIVQEAAKTATPNALRNDSIRVKKIFMETLQVHSAVTS